MPVLVESWLGRLCCVSPEELRRLRPFFGFYLILFAGLTLADGMSLTLFVSRVGADALPRYYGLTAVLNLVVVWGYMKTVTRLSRVAVFQGILFGCLGIFAAAWVAISLLPRDVAFGYGMFFVGREIAFVLVLAHFGTFLQDYFRKAELNRVLPIVYAGGRFGGLVGGWLLEHLTPVIGVPRLVFVFAALVLVASAVLRRVSRSIPIVDEAAEVNALTQPAEEGFLTMLRSSPLLLWFTVSSVLFMSVRWILNYQYNHYFEAYFSSEAELATFLGRYTQWALLGSLILQVFVFNRLVRIVGVKGAHAVTGLLFLVGMAINMGPMSLRIAVMSRLLEMELRLGLRNPVNQLVTNLFPRATRTRVRAWTLGALNPAATLLASGLLGTLRLAGVSGWIPTVGLILAIAHMAASLALYARFKEPAATLSGRVPGMLSRRFRSRCASRILTTATDRR